MADGARAYDTLSTIKGGPPGARVLELITYLRSDSAVYTEGPIVLIGACAVSIFKVISVAEAAFPDSEDWTSPWTVTITGYGFDFGPWEL